MENFEERLNEITDAALEAFWAVVVNRYTEIKSGDFDPFIDWQMNEAARSWVRHWLSVNKTTKEK